MREKLSPLYSLIIPSGDQFQTVKSLCTHKVFRLLHACRNGLNLQLLQKLMVCSAAMDLEPLRLNDFFKCQDVHYDSNSLHPGLCVFAATKVLITSPQKLFFFSGETYFVQSLHKWNTAVLFLCCKLLCTPCVWLVCTFNLKLGPLFC